MMAQGELGFKYEVENQQGEYALSYKSKEVK
jgi:hypothetical protein